MASPTFSNFISHACRLKVGVRSSYKDGGRYPKEVSCKVIVFGELDKGRANPATSGGITIAGGSLVASHLSISGGITIAGGGGGAAPSFLTSEGSTPAGDETGSAPVPTASSGITIAGGGAVASFQLSEKMCKQCSSGCKESEHERAGNADRRKIAQCSCRTCLCAHDGVCCHSQRANHVYCQCSTSSRGDVSTLDSVCARDGARSRTTATCDGSVCIHSNACIQVCARGSECAACTM